MTKKLRIPTGAKAASVYVMANFLSRGLAIITLPIFTRLLTTEQIGTVTLYNSWFALFSCLGTLSLTAGGFPVAMKEYEGCRRQYTSSVLTLTTLIACLFLFLYALNVRFWNDLTGLPTSLMVLIIVGLFLAPAMDFWLAFERYEYRYFASAIVTSVSALIASAASIAAVVFFSSHTGPTDLGEVRLIANYGIIYIIDAVIWLQILIRGRCFVNLDYWKFSLKLSLPLLGYSIASQVLSVSDRLMIGDMVGNSAVGIYGTVYSVASLFTVFWTAINSSFVPYMYQNIGKLNTKIKQISFSVLLFYSLMAVVVIYLAPEVLRILATEEYCKAIYIMPPIAVGVFYTSVANMYSNILLYEKSSKHIMLAAAIAAIVNVLLNFILIPKYGYMAAAYTTMFAYAVMLVVLFSFSNHVFMQKETKSLSEVYDNKGIIILVVAMPAVMMSGLLVYDYTFLRYLIVGILTIIGLITGIKLYNKQRSPQTGKN